MGIESAVAKCMATQRKYHKATQATEAGHQPASSCWDAMCSAFFGRPAKQSLASKDALKEPTATPKS